MRKFPILWMVAAACLVVASQAWAGTVASLLTVGPNTFSDDDREYLIDRTFSTPGAPGFGVKGRIDVGDSFRGFFDIAQLNSSVANVGGLTPNDELTGVFQVMVTNKIFVPVIIPLPGGGVLDLSFYAFQLGPDPDFGVTAGTPQAGIESCSQVRCITSLVTLLTQPRLGIL